MTTHCWGEKAAGDWVLEIYDSPSQLRSQKVPGMTVLLIPLLNKNHHLHSHFFNLMSFSETVEIEKKGLSGLSVGAAGAHMLLWRQ